MTTTTKITDTRAAIDESKLPANARLVLDWLCRQPAKRFDFTEIAEALQMPRFKVEAALSDLRHRRHGALIPSFQPDGAIIRSRYAWLPPDAAVRKGYPVQKHPKDPFPPAPPAPPPTPTQQRNASRANYVKNIAENRVARAEAQRNALARMSADRAGRAEDRRREREEARLRELGAAKTEEASNG